MTPPFCRPSLPVSLRVVSSVTTLPGILLCSQYTCYRQAQLRSVGAASIAWMGWCCCCWCSGGGLSDCCISSGHVVSSYSPVLSTLSQACPLLSASSSPSIGREIHGYSLEVWRVDSWAPPQVNGRLPTCLPTAPLPFWGDSTTSPSQMAAACFHVSVSHSHYGCDTVIYHVVFFIANIHTLVKVLNIY